MVVLTAETCWALNEYWIYNKISGIKLVSLYSTISIVVRSKQSLQEMRSEICLCTKDGVQGLVGMSSIWTNAEVKGKGKVKVHPLTDHEGPQMEQRYSSTLSLTSVLDGVGGPGYAPAALLPGKTRFPLYRRLSGPLGRFRRVRKISPSPGFDPWTVQRVLKKLFLI